MLRGFYSAASGMLYQQKKLNSIANNIGNLNTTGYKRESVVPTTFEQEYLHRLEYGKYTKAGANATPMVLVDDVVTDYEMGAFGQTGRTVDMALESEGFFVVDVDGEYMLTRNGNFAIDEEGYLVLPGAGRVQGMQGDIMVQNVNFTVQPNGTIVSDLGGVVDTLYVAVPGEDVELERQLNGLYASKEESLDTAGVYVPIENPKVLQGVLERSNVDMNREITAMVEAQRNFNTVNAAISIVDRLNEKTAMLASV